MSRRNTHEARTRVADTSLLNRSRVTNGQELLPGVDGRSVWARRLRDVIHLHTDDKGGDDELSEAERSILRRASVLTVELEYQEARFATLRSEGRAPSANDLDLYSRLAGNLRRLLESVGLNRRARYAGRQVIGDVEGYLDE